MRLDFVLNPDARQEGTEKIDVVFNFDVKRTFPSPTELVVVARVDLFEQQEGAPFRLTVEYEVRFSVPNAGHSESLRKFGRYNAAGILIPYLRETISDVTGRTNLGALVLPPVNVQALIDAIESRRETGGSKESQPPSSARIS